MQKAERLRHRERQRETERDRDRDRERERNKETKRQTEKEFALQVHSCKLNIMVNNAFKWKGLQRRCNYFCIIIFYIRFTGKKKSADRPQLDYSSRSSGWQSLLQQWMQNNYSIQIRCRLSTDYCLVDSAVSMLVFCSQVTSSWCSSYKPEALGNASPLTPLSVWMRSQTSLCDRHFYLSNYELSVRQSYIHSSRPFLFL